jgi:predicted AlkP superfamily pyrophosphatase or phosphodiesterase
MKRIFFLIIDQLNGHWEESVKIEGTNYPPVNVAGYHKLGLIPNFSYLITNGLWVKKPWNKGDCNTIAGMKYISTGSYLEKKYLEPKNRRPCYYYDKKGKYISFPVAAHQYYKKYGKKFVGGIFGYIPWTDDFFFDNCYAVCRSWDLNPRDDVTQNSYVFPWLKNNREWNLTTVYFQGLDEIGDQGCPSYTKSNNFRSSKHSYIKFLDGLLGKAIVFLKVEDFWKETYLIIISDHGAHLGCSWLAQRGIKTNNWWQNHKEPWDCEVWDFDNNKSTGIYSGGPRRIAFIVSGGALEEEYRGKYIEEAQIIDVAPTIAHLLGVPFKCEGKNIFESYKNKTL